MLLGLDLGTTNIKALTVENDGRIVSRASRSVSLNHTPDGGIEQDIDEIWQATIEAINEALSAVDRGTIQSIGISSQGAAMMFRDPDSEVEIGPVISWLDARGSAGDAELTERLGQRWLSQHVGHGQSNICAGQLLRLRRQSPELLRNKIAFVGDAIVRRLCGRAAHDASSLHICCLYNPYADQADPELLAELGIEPEQLPDLLRARESAGTLLPEMAQRLGLPAGILVGPAIHDQYAAALGCGAIEAGDVMFGAGTAWVLVAVADQAIRPVVPSAWISRHVLPERWGQLFSLSVGGSVIQWAAQMVGLDEAGASRIDALAGSVAPGADGLRLWPFLDATGGKQRPESGSMRGLRLSHTSADFLRAAIEGLCFELNRQLGWLEAGGCPVRHLMMTGGGARSTLTPQIVADVTGRPVRCLEESEISAFGAAILARAMVEPDAGLAELYKEMAGGYREVVPGPQAEIYGPLAKQYIKEVDASLRT